MDDSLKVTDLPPPGFYKSISEVMEAARAAGVEGALAAQVWGPGYEKFSDFYPSYEIEVLAFELALRNMLFYAQKAGVEPSRLVHYAEFECPIPLLFAPFWASVVDGVLK